MPTIANVDARDFSDLACWLIVQIGPISLNVTTPVHELRRVLERMPLQLYAQCVTLTHVARRAWEHGMLYFCQRMPGELARFRWVIDAKGNLVTPQEDWWRICVKPWLQSQTMRRPIQFLKGGDYSAFRRNFPATPLPDYLRELMSANKRRIAGDLGAVFGREMEFADSREYAGLQIADILTNCVRRALNGNLRRDGWLHIRKLMIRNRDGSVKFISMGDGDSVRNRSYGSVGIELAEGQRSLLTTQRYRVRRRS